MFDLPLLTVNNYVPTPTAALSIIFPEEGEKRKGRVLSLVTLLFLKAISQTNM